jgi:hypothetical protein
VLKNKSDQYSTAISGLMNHAASVRYRFSGILNCAECGSNLTIISARGKNRRTRYYGCPGHLHRGICSNNLCERRGLIEEKLLGGIRERLLESLAIDYAAAQIMKGLTAEAGHDQLGILQKKQAQLRLELARLGDAIATSGGSKTLLEVLTKKETELERIQMTASALARVHVPVDFAWLRKRVAEEIDALPTLLNTDPERAKAHMLGTCQRSECTRPKRTGKSSMSLKESGLSVKKRRSPELCSTVTFGWLRGPNLNQRPLGYEPHK